MKKSKSISISIILVVTLLLSLVNVLPVSAEETEFTTVTYQGQDLVDLLNIFDFQLVASEFQDFSDSYVVPVDCYQLFFHVGIKDAYILVNFPDVNNYYIKDKGLRLSFRSDIDLYASNWYSEVYKRFVTNNGDVVLDYGSVSFSTAVYAPYYPGSDHTYSYRNEASVDTKYTMSYPYFNGYTDPNTGYYYINETKPFQNGTDTSGYFYASSYRSILNLDFSDSYLGYEQLVGFDIDWQGMGYSAGAVIIGIKPITITATDEVIYDIQTAIGDLKDYFTTPTPNQNAQVNANKNKNNALKNDAASINDSISAGMEASIGGMSLDDLTPSFWDFSIGSDPLLLEGSNLYERLTSRLYANVWFVSILSLGMLPVVAGYLLYGKKG